MQRFELQPILSDAIPELADFVHKWRRMQAGGSPSRDLTRETSLGVERRLRWLLLENPVADAGRNLGYCLRDRTGAIQGVNLTFPTTFLAGDKRLLGLCSGSFFVDPPARSLGFYLFRKYLNSPGYSFFYATTCNAGSAALWETLGGRAVPNSDLEFVLPLRLDVMIPAFAAGKTSSPLAARVARIFGHCANPILRLLTRTAADLTIRRCDDWDRLSYLSRRHGPANQIRSHQSAEFLRWRYGATSPLYLSPCYLFWDRQGNEGWFSLGNLVRGEEGQIRGSVLLDSVWPRDRISPGSIFREIVRLSSGDADAIFLRSLPGLDYSEYSPWVIPRKLAAPRAYAITPKGAPPLALDRLCIDDTDDVAWKFRWTAAEDRPRAIGARSQAKALNEEALRLARMNGGR